MASEEVVPAPASSSRSGECPRPQILPVLESRHHPPKTHPSCRKPRALQDHRPGNGGQGVRRPRLRCGFSLLQLPRVRAACRKGHYRSQFCGAQMGSWLLPAGRGHRVKLGPSKGTPPHHLLQCGAENSLFHSLVYSINCVEVLLFASLGSSHSCGSGANLRMSPRV